MLMRIQKQLKNKKKKGFTLIELIVVIAILGILAAVAIPRFANMQANAKAGANLSSAASILSAADVSWAENQPTEPTAANLVTQNYLKVWPGAATDFVLNGTLGAYDVDYVVPTGADAKYTGNVK